MYEVHAEDNSEYTESCHYCGNCFKTRGDLMTHNKKTHSEKIQLCRNNLEGKCDFVESDCWFSHDVKAQKSSQLYTCNICKKTFKLRSDSMYHRKQEHKEIVPQYKNLAQRGYNTGHFVWLSLLVGLLFIILLSSPFFSFGMAYYL